MSYKALYRKYRPASFEDVAGQQHIVKTLNNSVKNDKIAHAYLFCGPRGTGKTSIAKLFAKSINCEAENKPCLKCKSCLEIAQGNNPDIIEIDAASNNGVEEARNLIDKVKFAPSYSKYKVYIIDEVHMMTTGAFNALLKTIEEPPEYVIFILATTEPEKVLETIISRCQRYDFARISNIDLIDRLKFIANEENIEIEDNAIEQIAILSEGGMRDALSIMDQVIAYAGNNVTSEDIETVYSLASTNEKELIISYAINKEISNLFNLIDSLKGRGIDFLKLTNEMIRMLKESILKYYKKENEEGILAAVSIKERQTIMNLFLEISRKNMSSLSFSEYFEIACLEICGLNNVSRETITASVPQTVKEEVKEIKPVNVPIVDTPQVAQEIGVIKENQVQEENVEIVEKPTIIEPIETNTDQILLSILLGANKDKKGLANEKISHANIIDIDISDINVFNIIKNSIVYAACDDAIILVVDNDILRNDIENRNAKGMFNNVTKQIFGVEMDVYAIEKDITKEFANKFIEAKNNGQIQNIYKKERTKESKLSKLEESLGAYGLEIKE